VGCRSTVRSLVNPRYGARCTVHGPENNRQAKAQPRPYQPPTESPFDQNAAQPRVGGAGYMTHRSLVNHSQVGEAVDEEEQVESTRKHREPGSPGLRGDESLSKIEGATNPKKLAGNEHHQKGDEEQVREASLLVGMYDPEGGPSNDQTMMGLPAIRKRVMLAIFKTENYSD
jgi:hypothetical protein